MKTIDRYLAFNTLWGILLVLFFLIIFISFMELLLQINYVGRGNYTMQDAFIFIVLTIPKRTVDFVPVSILLGSIISLGILADRYELVAMQASGISPFRICGSMLALAAFFVLACFFVAEFIAPPFDQNARIRRSKAIYSKQITVTKRGFWARHGKSFIHVGKTLSGGQAADIEIYTLDEKGKLHSFIQARNAVIAENGNWTLFDTKEKVFGSHGITTGQKKHLTLPSFLNSQQVSVLELPPDSLSLSDLHRYIQGLEVRGQNSERYALAFWQKLSMPLANLAMMLLSLTFIFGHKREISSGARIVLATVVGVGIYLLNHIFGNIGLLMNLHPAFISLLPILIIAGASLVMFQNLHGKKKNQG
jgi:lipopolysaccharide export system permease protein